MQKKSMKKNAVLNALRNCMNIAFPLITFPYVSRVLGVVGLGDYNYANSIISYFLMFAALGIVTYAVREGAQYRESRNDFSRFSSEIITINLISTVISYLLLFITLVFVQSFYSVRSYVLVFSLEIIFTTIGVDWIYTIYEDFGYITVRGLIFKLISVALMFLFVHSKDDVMWYVITTVIASVGSNTLNAIHARKYISLVKVNFNELKRHIRPILVIFASNIAVSIYINSDITMLGMMKSNYVVGIYSTSTKIYNIIKNLLAAILIVSIPRFSLFAGNKETQKFNELLQKVIDYITLLLVPAVFGMVIYSKNIIRLVSGSEYISAYKSLIILSSALIFSIFSWIYSSCVLIPYKRENYYLMATVISAFINIGLNLVLIPRYSEIAAAFTTFLSELFMFLICYLKAKPLCKAKILNKNTLDTVIACAGITLLYLFARDKVEGSNILFIALIILSVVVYFGIHLILRNHIVVEQVNSFKGRIHKA